MNDPVKEPAQNTEKTMGDIMREIMAWPLPALPRPTHNAPERNQ
ncbi:hypothetical protein [Sulfitobacter sp. W027]|nr:hypothetical protein [Sulfitobacter sp. W027]